MPKSSKVSWVPVEPGGRSLTRFVKETRSHCPGVASLLESCRAVAATCELLKEAEKVFFGTAYHHLCTPPSVEPARAKRKSVAHCWKNRAGTKQFKTLSKFNLASLLPEPDSAMLMHDCAEIIK